ADNDLSRYSNSKGSIELRTAQWFYVSGNRISGGTLRVGLPEEDKVLHPEWASLFTGNGVVENNNVDKNVFFNIRPGVQHVAFRGNVLRVDNDKAILMECVKDGYDQVRKTDDVRIYNNTVIN